MGQVDHALEIALILRSFGARGGRRLLFGRRLGGQNGGGGKARGGSAFEKSTPAERLQRVLASGNTHDRPPVLGADATRASAAWSSIAPAIAGRNTAPLLTLRI